MAAAAGPMQRDGYDFRFEPSLAPLALSDRLIVWGVCDPSPREPEDYGPCRLDIAVRAVEVPSGRALWTRCNVLEWGEPVERWPASSPLNGGVDVYSIEAAGDDTYIFASTSFASFALRTRTGELLWVRRPSPRGLCYEAAYGEMPTYPCGARGYAWNAAVWMRRNVARTTWPALLPTR
ncbi:MAG TPA: hypothetical protein VGM56_14605 [Byssovorax sp.]